MTTLIVTIRHQQETTLNLLSLALSALPEDIPWHLIAPKELIVVSRSFARRPVKAWALSSTSGPVDIWNKILKETPDDDLLFLEGNTAPDSGQTVVDLLNQTTLHPEAALLGVKTILPTGDIYSFGRRIIQALGIRENHVNACWMETDMGQRNHLEKIDSALGSLLWIRRAALKEVGDSFDPNFCPGLNSDFLYPTWMAMDDLSLRCIAKGWKVNVIPEIKVHYIPPHPLPSELSIIEAAQSFYKQWEKKWGWNPELPEFHAIRQKWSSTPLCQWIGSRLLDSWPEPQPPVDVLIVTSNDLANLQECLDHLRKTDYPKYQLHILINGSTDKTAEYLESVKSSYPVPINLITVPVSLGAPAALNWLIKVTSSPVFALVDSDAFVPPHWLKQMTQTLHHHPYAGAVGVKVLDRDQPNLITWSERRVWDGSEQIQNEIDDGQRDYVARTLISTGCCQLYRRRVFEETGLFDLHFSPSGVSDIDHHIAMRIAGYDILYDGNVGVRHSFRKRSKQAMRLFDLNRLKLSAKWGRDATYILDKALDFFERRQTFERKHDNRLIG